MEPAGKAGMVTVVVLLQETLCQVDAGEQAGAECEQQLGQGEQTESVAGEVCPVQHEPEIEHGQIRMAWAALYNICIYVERVREYPIPPYISNSRRVSLTVIYKPSEIG